MHSIQKALLFFFLLFSLFALYSQTSCDKIQLFKIFINLLSLVITAVIAGFFFCNKTTSNILSGIDQYGKTILSIRNTLKNEITIYNTLYQRSCRYEY